MTQSAELDAAAMQAWRDAVRDDTLTQYSLGMGVAVHRREGAQAALPWFEQARRSPVRRAESAVALIDALRALGRDEEAGRLAEEARAESARYKLDGLAALADLYRETPGVDGREAIDLIDRGLALADRCGEPADRLKMRLRRGVLLWSAGQTDRALADWACFHEADFALASIDAELVDLLDLVSGALWHDQRFELAAAIDMRSVLALPDAGSVDPVDRQRLVFNLVKRGGAYLDAATADRVMPTILSVVDDQDIQLAVVRFAVALLDNGLYKAAASVFAALMARGPDSLPAQWLRAEIVVRTARPEQCAEIVCGSMSGADENPQFGLAVAHALLAAGLFDNAIRVADRVSARNESMVPMVFVRALAEQAKGDHTAAAKSFARFQSVATHPGHRLRAQAVALHGVGRSQEALSLIEEAVRSTGAAFDRVIWGLVLRAVGRWQESQDIATGLLKSYSPVVLRRIINIFVGFRSQMNSMFIDAGGGDILVDDLSFAVFMGLTADHDDCADGAF